MKLIEFNTKEKEALYQSITERKRQCTGDMDMYKTHLEKLAEIEKSLSLPLVTLSPLQRATLIGCLREAFIYPNEDLWSLSEHQLLFRDEALTDKLIQIDVALSAINKLKKKNERKSRLFVDTLNKLDALLKTKQVYYSITGNGKIYKAAIVLDKQMGVRLHLDSFQAPNQYVLEKLSKRNYMKQAAPGEVLSLLDQYSQEYQLTKSQEAFKEFLELALDRRTELVNS